MRAIEAAALAGADAELPEGWAGASLADLCLVITDGTHQTPEYLAKGVPFVSTSNLNPFHQGFDFSTYQRFISPKAHENLTRRVAPTLGDVLIAKCGTIGRAKEVDVVYPFSIFVGLALLRPLPGTFAPRFLEVALNAPESQKLFDELAPGSTRRTLTLGAIRRVRVPLPPLAEQRRIVAQVEALLARANAARERLAKVPAILKRFRQAVLAAACSGRLTEEWRGDIKGRIETERETAHNGQDDLDDESNSLPESWRRTPLDQLAQRVTDGTHQPPPLTLHGIPFLLIGNIAQGRVDWGSISKWVSNQTYEALTVRCRPERGDVLYTAVGATFGQALAVDWDHKFVFQRHIAHIKPKRQLVEAGYLVLALNAPATYARATELARGAAQPTVTLGDLKQFPIALPPLAEQHEIVRRVDALFKLADAIERRVAAVTARAEKLTQAILAKAFRGKLVPTEAELARREGRGYEPASVLLERLRAEREAREPSPRPSPKGRGRRRAEKTHRIAVS